MENTCSNCKYWRIKSDETGICDNPEWKVCNSLNEDLAYNLLKELPYNSIQKLNLVRQLLAIRTNADFGCNQHKKI